MVVIPKTRKTYCNKCKEEDVMTENNQDMVDKPNLSSEKKLKLPKKLHSDYSATSVRQEES
jgi:ribosomal protein L44E